ncbi:hypothetical protein FFWV33_07965 [Flavobacterium faecale]|uniref:Exostosin GT47 domain-containing protein n=1 Tax=Flavobacterium faecale TaxID=1355330 RepID=A0A2S1LCJ6_9FLAO|nr:hypothetical protein [Flavobacterium faecale]AWG21475.1 hypothetical protein FFWV33_07965 [Flavobacterium faecale]
MIKLYTDQSFLTEANRKVVFPLLFDLWYLPNTILLEKYQLVDSVESCDIAVIPVDLAHYGTTKMIHSFIQKALHAKKMVWVYSAGDYGQTLTYPVYTFRHGGIGSRLDKSTFVLPAFISDPLKHLGHKFESLHKESKPQIGFVGHANNSVSKRIKELLIYLKYRFDKITAKLKTDAQPFYPSSSKRFKLLKLLADDGNVETDFIFRKKYKGGFTNQQDSNQGTTVFFENIDRNPYTFCLRGAGNFSVRFYETLAMGRIPFVIDTDFKLPLNHNIDWKNHCVIASEKQVVQKLLSFHNSISESDFKKMQVENRNLWLNFLEREAYFLQVYTVFKQKINEV